MVVYLLYSNWMHNGDNVANEVIGVYDCLAKAQHSLVECINSDLQFHPYDNLWADCTGDILGYDIPSLACMYYDDEDFFFDVKTARLWNGDNEDCSEDFQSYMIEEREVY